MTRFDPFAPSWLDTEPVPRWMHLVSFLASIFWAVVLGYFFLVVLPQ
jgi:hypothetical protein